eukprot:scaffold31941_cov24-Tisochrysis_lutea.AAC.1
MSSFLVNRLVVSPFDRRPFASVSFNLPSCPMGLVAALCLAQQPVSWTHRVPFALPFSSQAALALAHPQIGSLLFSLWAKQPEDYRRVLDVSADEDDEVVPPSQGTPISAEMRKLLPYTASWTHWPDSEKVGYRVAFVCELSGVSLLFGAQQPGAGERPGVLTSARRDGVKSRWSRIQICLQATHHGQGTQVNMSICFQTLLQDRHCRRGEGRNLQAIASIRPDGVKLLISNTGAHANYSKGKCLALFEEWTNMLGRSNLPLELRQHCPLHPANLYIHRRSEMCSPGALRINRILSILWPHITKAGIRMGLDIGKQIVQPMLEKKQVRREYGCVYPCAGTGDGHEAEHPPAFIFWNELIIDPKIVCTEIEVLACGCLPHAQYRIPFVEDIALGTKSMADEQVYQPAAEWIKRKDFTLGKFPLQLGGIKSYDTPDDEVVLETPIMWGSDAKVGLSQYAPIFKFTGSRLSHPNQVYGAGESQKT